jgi:hypothetical protein
VYFVPSAAFFWLRACHLDLHKERLFPGKKSLLYKTFPTENIERAVDARAAASFSIRRLISMVILSNIHRSLYTIYMRYMQTAVARGLFQQLTQRTARNFCLWATPPLPRIENCHNNVCAK